MKPLLTKPEINAIIYGMHGAPFSLLGMHATGAKKPGVVARVFRPYATKVELIRRADGQVLDMPRIHEDGLYELFLPNEKPFDYLLRLTWFDGTSSDLEDPYRFPLQLTDFDMHLLGEGTNYRAYNRMGAHPMTVEGVEGVHFAVWAPNAIRVSVVGWFNNWDGRIHPMQQRGNSGIWELFMPHLKPGDLYKYEVKGHQAFLAQKADPYAFASELRPRSASMVWDIEAYEWQDAEWMAARDKRNWLEEPISVYEVHLGSWRRKPDEDGRMQTYAELADTLIPYVKKMGYTHIELMPISEHPFDGSWGYQTIGYYSPTSRFGTPDDFKAFVDRCHQEGIGVIVDWVPAHFPKDGHGLAYFDGTHLYEHADPRMGEHKDWGTYIFNYGRNEVKNFLTANALFWLEKYHVDGLRVDAVASILYLDYSRKHGEWVPNKYGGRENLEAIEFLQHFNHLAHTEYPGVITIAEESTAWPQVTRPPYMGGLGFDFKWNMGWMHDTLAYFQKEPIHRKFHHNNLTFGMLYHYHENFILPFSHDEVVHGKGSLMQKMPGDDWQKAANLRSLLAWHWLYPGKKLLFMGCEFGPRSEWNENESLPWHILEQGPYHCGIQRLVADLNQIYRVESPLWHSDYRVGGFQWIDCSDYHQSTYSFFREGQKSDDVVLVVMNLTPIPRYGYRIGLPRNGKWIEILNSDAEVYAGSNAGNGGGIQSEPIEYHGQPWSALLTLPPLGVCVFKYKGKHI